MDLIITALFLNSPKSASDLFIASIDALIFSLKGPINAICGEIELSVIRAVKRFVSSISLDNASILNTDVVSNTFS
jgi:hypothetical protein